MIAAADVVGTVTDGRRPLPDVVVWLEGDERSKPMRKTLTQKNKIFEPHVMVVTKGSTIDFPNEDYIFHNVFAEYNATKFDLGMYPHGQTRSHRFDAVGTVSILCNMHAEMSAFVVIVDTPYFTKTDSKGRFRIPGVPSGHYSARAWHESRREATKPIDISGATTIDFVVARPKR